MIEWMGFALMLALVPNDGIASGAGQTHQAGEDGSARGNFAYLDYHADYQVNDDATHVETNTVSVLIHNKVGVDQWSQVRLDYSEKLETLEVLEAYTVSTDGIRNDVPPASIHTQESYSSASAAMYADRKVRVVVFPNLEPGTRLHYSYRLTRLSPHFPGYFGFRNTYNRQIEYRKARVTLSTPASLPMHVYAGNGARGSDKPVVRDGRARWEWSISNPDPLPSQGWAADSWTFSPTVMASTFAEWSALGHAYHVKAAEAAAVTPAVERLAAEITVGLVDRREQARALYEWVASNIRYVAVYLGNGGLEPNPVDSILGNRYGDCKDHVVALDALLAAKGIASTPVLIGAGNSPLLPPVVLLNQFNHAITYIPELDLYLDSTNQFAPFGQLPMGNLGAPVVHSNDGLLSRTPAPDGNNRGIDVEMELEFSGAGDLAGDLHSAFGGSREIGWRQAMSPLNTQNLKATEAAILSAASMDGSGKITLEVKPHDLSAPFTVGYRFNAMDVVDFTNVGGITLPDTPAVKSIRHHYMKARAESNEVPFDCSPDRREESYRLRLPDDLPVIAIPDDMDFSNPAGSYQSRWTRDGQSIAVTHTLVENAIHGAEQLCQPDDYLEFQELYRQVRRGFRGQILHGQLPASP